MLSRQGSFRFHALDYPAGFERHDAVRDEACLTEDVPAAAADVGSRSARSALLRPAGVSAFAVVLAFCWTYQIEAFPFTAMQMYSVPQQAYREGVTYYRVLAFRESGESSPVDFGEVIGAFKLNGRHRRAVAQCFQQASVQVCRDFLALSGRIMAEQDNGEDPLAYIEARKYVWDFRADPADPGYGRVVDSIVVGVTD